MAHEPSPTLKSEAWPNQPDPSFASPRMAAASRLPGTSPNVDEAMGRQMEQEQQMHEIAEQIGTALGKAVNGVRGIPDRVRNGLHVVKGEALEHAGSATDAASELAQSMSETISGLRQDAAQTAAKWREKASRRAVELNELAGDQIADVRSRVARATRENPIQLILAVAAASIAIGFGLRIWRSGRG